MTGAQGMAGRAAEEASGALTAQTVIAEIARDEAPAELAWVRFCEAAALHGWKSPRCRAFVVESFKRAARGERP